MKGFVDETTNYAAAESDAVYFTISAAAGSISYATTPVEKTLAAPAFTNPLTKVGDGIVSYTCAGDNICTVNASTGEVTLNGTPGSCTITATVTNSTSYTYATNTASYTLTVLSVLDLSLVTADTTVPDGVTVTGTLGGDYKISIAAGATVTLKNVTINRTSISNPGITCNGTATITLVGTNTVNGGTNQAGIRIGGTGTTLTIEGDGSLSATAGGMSAGIGIGRAWSAGTVTGGNIVINGGTITAQGGSQWGAGIGTGAAYETAVTIGNITINGGEVTATGGSQGGDIHGQDLEIQLIIRLFGGEEGHTGEAFLEGVEELAGLMPRLRDHGQRAAFVQDAGGEVEGVEVAADIAAAGKRYSTSASSLRLPVWLGMRKLASIVSAPGPSVRACQPRMLLAPPQ